MMRCEMISKCNYGIYIAMIIILCIAVVGCGNTKSRKGVTGGAAASGEPKTKPTVKATTTETRDVTLTWDDVPGATSYNIYLSDKPGVTKKNGAKISNVKNPHKISELKKGIKYYFVVTAVNASGESKESEEFSITVGH
jgi:fibronectin type 3 domain-containing protein